MLVFGLLEVSILFAGALMAGLIAANGNSNWLEGAELLVIYTIAGLVFWYL